MLNNFWNKVVEWFTDKQERNRLIRGFNNSARAAFVTGEAPTLLHASLSRGNSDYRHQFSHWLNSGFRIEAKFWQHPQSGAHIHRLEAVQS